MESMCWQLTLIGLNVIYLQPIYALLWDGEETRWKTSEDSLLNRNSAVEQFWNCEEENGVFPATVRWVWGVVYVILGWENRISENLFFRASYTFLHLCYVMYFCLPFLIRIKNLQNILQRFKSLYVENCWSGRTLWYVTELQNGLHVSRLSQL